MKKLIPAAVTLLLACNSAYAGSWPWQDTEPVESQSYCMGLVVSGLTSNKVAGMSRSELWQAWSYLIRSGALSQVAPSDEYQSGLAQFRNAADPQSAETVLDNAMGDCGLGRSGRQVTGW